LAYSNDCIATRNTAALELDWQFASGLLSGTADESGSNPYQEKEQPSSSLSPKTPREASPRTLNLLLAEDNLPDALLVKEAIKTEKLPLEVHLAPDGERALDFISRAEKDPDAPCPDVLLLDLNLPRVEGFEVLLRVRASEKCRAIPVLIVTSSASQADRSEAARLGAGYFRKPVTYDEFIKIGGVIRGLLEEHGLL
jgi:CheY-like chemotaxis protein